MKIKRALLSVTDKTGLVELAAFLAKRDVELLASGGTRRHLEAAGVSVTEVSAWTQSPEALGGRVKTLHPKVFGGILADPELHAEDLAEHDFPLIDLVVVNLYRFRAAAASANADETGVVEAIDIGGPSLLRAAAKNFGRVAVLCDPGDYAHFMETMGSADAESALELRRGFAARAFAHTRDYDTAISAWMSGNPGERWPLLADLRYGENPHQSAWLHGWQESDLPFRQLGGKELSYNNYLDLGAALDLLLDYESKAAVVVKHGNPCGAAVAGTSTDALNMAWASDPVSAFGSIVAVNEPLSLAAAAFLAGKFVEVVVAPAFEEGAAEKLAAKKNLRVLEMEDLSRWRCGQRLRSVGPLLLRQEEDLGFAAASEWKVGSGGKPSGTVLADLEAAWRTVKHVKSNAVLLWKDGSLLAAGAGQTSRVDSCRLAVEKALELGHDPRGSVAASDAFFPFPDGLEILAEAGVSAVVQPGGSIRDDEVLARAEELELTVLLTGRRHFRH